jgi:hypothetical protein
VHGTGAPVTNFLVHPCHALKEISLGFRENSRQHKPEISVYIDEGVGYFAKHPRANLIFPTSHIPTIRCLMQIVLTHMTEKNNLTNGSRFMQVQLLIGSTLRLSVNHFNNFVQHRFTDDFS